ncbi:MAG: GntR family transcriptional regulator [Clostridia bacterium]|nr:GntR family transcriptional regulator [Clostridia bacterium]
MGKTEDAYRLIKDKIVRGIYPPMSDISEEALQQELGTSRTPVREALMRLERDGLVMVYPRKGTIVTDVTRDLIEEIYIMRKLNEPEMSVMSMRTIDRSWLTDIRSRFLQPPAELSSDALRSWYLSLDDELHSTVILNSPNRFLRQAMQVVYDQNVRMRYLTSQPTRQGDHTIEEHVAIVDAFLAEDPEAVRRTTLYHLEMSQMRTHRDFR